ncbi:hypothetical protein G8E10_09415 [Rhizobiaceae bacterium CRRU44]|uniref:Uncharacterized protein n=1 Tax=Ferranicluibacter rubi TaxID=2715133 RepID=A0AA43ZDQ1_9HYPH|nr:hypothetical protein [Ferranicluibacter rubi]NHT75897.1 hypothetical protein [Ferranicluibacter rubi]NHT75957.1 hypothetical protein [Ferranicluibacter rubi]
MKTIALAKHPANMDASAHEVLDVTIGRSTGTVFRVTNGFVPGFKGMTAPGYMPDVETAVEWIEAFAAQEAA